MAVVPTLYPLLYQTESLIVALLAAAPTMPPRLTAPLPCRTPKRKETV